MTNTPPIDDVKLELLPCPFCGEQPQVKSRGAGGVGCHNGHHVQVYGATVEDAEKAWNTRTPPHADTLSLPREAGEEGLRCFDCGAQYDDPAWIEAVVPHDIWNQHLSPTGGEGGILCIVCMGRRATAAGLSDVPVRLTAGPFLAMYAAALSRPSPADGEAWFPTGAGPCAYDIDERTVTFAFDTEEDVRFVIASMPSRNRSALSSTPPESMEKDDG
jgi:hypothetical protein